MVGKQTNTNEKKWLEAMEISFNKLIPSINVKKK